MILSGQKALVTGASSGIGLATAIALGKAGADVVVNYISGEEQAEAAVGEIRRSGRTRKRSLCCSAVRRSIPTRTTTTTAT